MQGPRMCAARFATTGVTTEVATAARAHVCACVGAVASASLLCFVASHHRPLSPPGMCVDLSSDVPYEDGEREKESVHVAEPTIPKAQEVEQGGRLRSNGSAGVAVSATEVA